jgi:hypothetical protein
MGCNPTAIAPCSLPQGAQTGFTTSWMETKPIRWQSLRRCDFETHQLDDRLNVFGRAHHEADSSSLGIPTRL